MIVSIVSSLVVNTLAFLAIAKLLPGFTMKKPETAVKMAVVYGVISWLAFAMLGGLVFGALTALFLLIPFLGLLAAFAVGMSAFVLNFIVGVAILIATDTLLEDFEMDGPATAVIAALLLGLIGGTLRHILGA